MSRQILDTSLNVKRSKSLKVVVFIGLVFGFSGTGMAADEKSATQESLERRQKVEILSYFMKDPGQAKLPGSNMGVSLYNQAVGYMQKNEYALARKAATDSLQVDNLNPLTYELLGDIDNLEHNLQGAKSNYEAAYRLGQSNSLRQKLEKLGKEQTIDKDLSRYDEEHFIIKYLKTEKQYDGFELRELLRKTYGNVSSDMGYYIKSKIVVLLYDDDAFRQLTGLPHWVAGVYDGKVRMPINRQGFKDEDIRSIAAHEVTHVFVSALSGRNAPPWINEGLAVYEENKIKKRDDLVFKSAVKTKNLFSFAELMGQTETNSIKDPLRIELFYEQAFQVVRYLVDRYGMFKVKQILEQYGKGKNSSEAIRTALQISPDRLEKEWKESIKS